MTLTILVVENIFFTAFLLIWLNRTCKKCHKVKCIERVFNKTCRDCANLISKKAERKEKR